MSFFYGVILGIGFGIWLVVAFTRCERARSKSRLQVATIIAAFARMTVEDTRKIFPGELYPPWVVFSEKQKLDWFNTQLDMLWPYVDVAASEMIRSTTEPILEYYKPFILQSLTFSKLTLGTVPPYFTGITLLESGSGNGEVTLELEMEWNGNPDLILDIRSRVGLKLPIEVKNIAFSGLVRITLKPLLPEFPCFGAVAYSLRENRNLDFQVKVLAGDISAIPGVSEAIEETIRDAIEDSITWPVRNITPILPGDYSDMELKPCGTLDVKLVQAKGLSNKDIIGKSDPFAELFVRPTRERMKTSKTINNQLNPIWNEHFEFAIEDESTQSLTVRVYDDDGVQSAQLLGCARVALKDLEPAKVKDVWLKLVKDLQVQRDKKDRGQVELELLYCPFGTESSLKIPFNPDFRLTSLEKALKIGTETDSSTQLERALTRKKKEIIVRGVLNVTVISAENLPVVDFLGKADPYVVVTMKKSNARLQSRVVHNNLNPIWNQTFDFVVEDGLHEMLILEVWDHDTFGKDKIGRCILTLTRVLLEGTVQDTYPIDGSLSGVLNLHLKWTPKTIFRDP